MLRSLDAFMKTHSASLLSCPYPGEAFPSDRPSPRIRGGEGLGRQRKTWLKHHKFAQSTFLSSACSVSNRKIFRFGVAAAEL